MISCATRHAGVEFIGPNMIEATHLSPCRIGPHVYLERGAEVHQGAQIEDSMVLTGASIGRGAIVKGSLVGPGARVAEGETVLDRILA